MKTNYVLIDMENVTPENMELLDQEWIRVFLFVGKNQTKLPLSIVKDIQRLGARAKYIEMSGTGHNALDFHIAYYIGHIAALDKNAYFHIVSNDAGFDPLISHLKQERVFADRVAEVAGIPALIQARVVSKTPAEKIAFAKERLAKTNATRPRTRMTLTSHIAAMFLKALPPEDVDAIVEGLFHDGYVKENGKRITYLDEKP